MRGSLEACPGWRSATRWVFGLDSMTPRGRRAGGPEAEADSPTAAVITVRAQTSSQHGPICRTRCLPHPPASASLPSMVDSKNEPVGAATSQRDDSPNSATRAASHRRPASTNTALAQLMAHEWRNTEQSGHAPTNPLRDRPVDATSWKMISSSNLNPNPVIR